MADLPIENRFKYGVWNDADAEQFADVLSGKPAAARPAVPAGTDARGEGDGVDEDFLRQILRDSESKYGR